MDDLTYEANNGTIVTLLVQLLAGQRASMKFLIEIHAGDDAEKKNRLIALQNALAAEAMKEVFA